MKVPKISIWKYNGHSTTLVIYLGSHEWYFWFKDRKLKYEHHVN